MKLKDSQQTKAQQIKYAFACILIWTLHSCGSGGGSGGGGSETPDPTPPPLPAPPALLSSSLSSHDFLTVLSGGNASVVLTISNIGAQDATDIVLVPPSAPFSIVSTDCAALLAPSATCDMTIGFSPVVAGLVQSEVRLDYVNANGPQLLSIPIQGTGLVPAVLSITPAPHDFGNVAINTEVTQVFTLSHTAGSEPATGIVIPPLANPYAIQSTDCGASLGIGSSCSINVSFMTPTSGSFLHDLNVQYVNFNGAQVTSSSLTATGFSPDIIPKNFANSGRIMSGLLTGTVNLLGAPVDKVQVDFDSSGTWVDATGTASWSIALPIWKLETVHTVDVKLLGTSGQFLGQETFSIKRGMNKDLNRDGFSDSAVGAYQSDMVTGNVLVSSSNRGAVFVFHGGDSGLPATPSMNLYYPSTDNSAFYGAAVSFADDVNGDGYGDLVVGAYSSDYTTGGVFVGGSSRGAAYVYHGSATGVSSTPNQTLYYPGTDNTASFGIAVAALGDANNDGYADIVIGAENSDLGGSDRGAVYVYNGSISGVGSSPSVAISYPDAANSANFGSSVSSAGDFNGDGFLDLLVGARGSDVGGSNRGAAYIFNGSASGVSSTASRKIYYPSTDSGATFGRSVTYVGDVNGDNLGDVLIGADQSDVVTGGGIVNNSNRGTAYVYHGRTDAVVSPPPTTSIYYPRTDNNANFGRAVSSMGDINGDQRDDIAIGAWRSDFSGSDRGVVYIYQSNGVSIPAVPTTTLSYAGTDNTAYFGIALSGMTDVNGDGLMDLMVGAYQSDLVTGGGMISGANRGVSMLFTGISGGINSTPSTLFYPFTDASAFFGYSVATLFKMGGFKNG